MRRDGQNRGQCVSKTAFIGVYSSSTTKPKEGRGAAKRKTYWFAWDCGDEGYRVQELDDTFQPKGEPLPMDFSTFQVSFVQEPSVFAAPIKLASFPASPVQPQSPQPSGGAAKPEQRAAEWEEVESHVRAHFAALLLKIRRGDGLPDALQALRDIAEMEEGIVPEHKHMFAEFGINLRKGKLPEIALAHAKRVLSLAPGDSHGHFNIARIYHVLGELGEAEQHLQAALEFSPDLGYARDFLAYIGKERRLKGLDDRKGRQRL